MPIFPHGDTDGPGRSRPRTPRGQRLRWLAPRALVAFAAPPVLAVSGRPTIPSWRCRRILGLPEGVVHVFIRGSASSGTALHQAGQTSRPARHLGPKRTAGTSSPTSALLDGSSSIWSRVQQVGPEPAQHANRAPAGRHHGLAVPGNKRRSSARGTAGMQKRARAIGDAGTP